ncbi:RES family NAD+ phosphorylase [Brevundimonas sp.]|uniref:RES family NAD+ phosphorylase n=1 Tax=Brevundimonas sp. TaxID=1871086 RepID=UPI0035AFA770
MIDGLPIVRKAFERTVRLVSSARLRPPVLEDLVPPEMMDALHELEGATSGRLNGQWRGTVGIDKNEFVYGVQHAAFINASFAYPRPNQLNRFNGDARGAWYAALDVRTCLEEIKFHITQELENINEFRTRIEYAEMHASFAGDFLDLTAANDHECLHPDPAIGYPVGNAVADAARAHGLNLIMYPSIRHKGGTCFAALSPHAVQSVAQGDVWEMIWTGDAVPIVQPVAKAA